jgi:GTP:adenosylcobinamide-phosphate guanylyltransferase
MQTTFDAVILAGRDPNRPDPLAVANGVAHKALVDLAGHPLIWYVVRALASSHQIGRIVVVGLGLTSDIDFGRPVQFLPDAGSLLDNVQAAFGWLAEQQPTHSFALLLTADTPLLTPVIIDWFIQACQPLRHDVYWGIVERSCMEATFPQSQRTYLRLVEGHFCSGDLFLGKIESALKPQVILRQLIAERKNVVRQLRLLGWRVVIKFILHRLTMRDLLHLFAQLLGLQGAAIVLPFAEAGMDVDKPHQLAQVRDYLASRDKGLS